ncbi:MAG TPA: hypothetical protein VJS13_01070 [Pyrinomonadaceae bacterium]|nr:hypothetical protein [Pyrinomonadaceae bacterium]
MYCANCGTQLVAGLSYCNRCGFDLRERVESNTASITAFLTAITLTGIVGLAIMFAGALVLRRGALLSQELIGFFMLFTFLITGLTEFMLFRNLSRLTAPRESKMRSLPPPMANDLRLPHASHLGEPVPSVTENTTRTLEYLTREHGRT